MQHQPYRAKVRLLRFNKHLEKSKVYTFSALLENGLMPFAVRVVYRHRIPGKLLFHFFMVASLGLS